MKELRILKDKVEHLEDQKLQYERQLTATKVKWVLIIIIIIVVSRGFNIPSLPTFRC